MNTAAGNQRENAENLGENTKNVTISVAIQGIKVET